MAHSLRVGVLRVSVWIASLGVGAVGSAAGEGDASAGGAVASGREVRLARAGVGPGGVDGSLAPRVARPLAALQRRLPAGVDSTAGQPVEMGGDRVLRFVYCDTFAEPWFTEDAAIEGVSCLRWDSSAPVLHLEGRGPGRRRMSLTYHFTAPYDGKELVTSVQGVVRGGRADRVELTMSTDGKEFIHPARACGRAEGNAFHLTSAASYQFDRSSFWIRVAADLAPGARVSLSEFTANCRVKPPGRREVTLAPDAEGRMAYRDELASSRLLHLAEVENAQALEWRRGMAFLRGGDGGAAQVAIRQRFVAPCPLRSIVVRVRHAVGPQAPGGSNSVGISLNGATLVAQRTTPGGDAGFAGVTELRLDDPAALADARRFYLHITLAGGAPGTPANVLSGIEVEARGDEASAPTVASTSSPSARP
ncbi:MAG TPA: hypothetical protein VNE39_18820 [Planctomycetota bacterium]|nr:hypothetical protein [Planctomycetota bacterium]